MEEKQLNCLLFLTNVYLCFLLMSWFISRKTHSTHWQLIKKQNPIKSVIFCPELKAPTVWVSVVAATDPVGCLSARSGRRNICRLVVVVVALLPKPIWLRDSRLTSHLIWLLFSRPSLWSSSFRVTCNLWIWASLVRAISFTGRWTPVNLPASNKERQQQNKKRHQGQIISLSAA